MLILEEHFRRHLEAFAFELIYTHTHTHTHTMSGANVKSVSEKWDIIKVRNNSLWCQKLRQVPGVRKIALQLSVPHFLYAMGIQ